MGEQRAPLGREDQIALLAQVAVELIAGRDHAALPRPAGQEDDGIGHRYLFMRSLAVAAITTPPLDLGLEAGNEVYGIARGLRA
jgi:hypothetical protein